MATDGRETAIIETSVLVNFLKIDRTDLLGAHPTHRFVVPDLVRREVIDRYGAQVDRLEAALTAGHVLADVAPTVLDLMGLDLAPQMTGKSLVVRG